MFLRYTVLAFPEAGLITQDCSSLQAAAEFIEDHPTIKKIPMFRCFVFDRESGRIYDCPALTAAVRK